MPGTPGIPPHQEHRRLRKDHIRSVCGAARGAEEPRAVLGNPGRRTPHCLLRAVYDAAHIAIWQLDRPLACHRLACWSYSFRSPQWVRGLDDRYSWLQHAACRATPRDALHARQQTQGPCYSGALEEIEEIGRRWRWRCGLRRTRRSVAIRISVSYWYQSYRRSFETWKIDSPTLSLACLS
jgi:hypothetical protein